MNQLIKSFYAYIMSALGIMVMLTFNLPASAMNPDDTLAVKLQQIPARYQAYAQVEPVQTLVIRTQIEGTLQDLRVLPGMAVQAGQILARLGGRRVQSVQDQQRLQQQHAHALWVLAQKQAALTTQKMQVHLATQADLLDAQAKQDAAGTQRATADLQIRALSDDRLIRTPVSGTILSVQVTNGQDLSAGSSILTLLPKGQLGLTAILYGDAARQVQLGMTGFFTPSGSQRSWPVHVISRVARGLGLQIGMQADLQGNDSSLYEQGVAGTVVLQGAPRPVAMVPTRALILDRGQWWVLVQTQQGDRAQAVQPGAAQGWWTEVTSGLSAGMHVVIRDAYLRYHRDIMNNYLLPD